MASEISPDSLFKDALTLSDQQRAALAALLIESLEPQMDDEIESAWRQELHKRAEELKAGEASAVPWEETRAKLGLTNE